MGKLQQRLQCLRVDKCLRSADLCSFHSLKKPAEKYNPNQKLTERDDRYLRQVTVRTRKSASEINLELNLPASERCI